MSNLDKEIIELARRHGLSVEIDESSCVLRVKVTNGHRPGKVIVARRFINGKASVPVLSTYARGIGCNAGKQGAHAFGCNRENNQAATQDPLETSAIRNGLTWLGHTRWLVLESHKGR